MSVRLLLAASLAALAATALVACGGDDDDGADPESEETTSTATRTTTATSGSSSASPSATEADDGTAAAGSPSPTGSAPGATSSPTSGSDAPSGPGGGNSGTSGGDDSAEFKELLEGNETNTYSITYAVSGEGEETTWTLAQDPPRSAAIVVADGQTIRIIDDGTDQYTCFGDDDNGQCLKATDAGLDPGAVVGDATEDAEQAAVTEVEGRSIAGRDARCFEYAETADAEGGTVCVDEDKGYMLFLETAGTSMTATDVTEDVPDDMFEPPFDVIG